MVDYFKTLANNIQELSGKIPEFLMEIVKEHEYVILDMNTQEQLFEQGVNRLGVKLSDFAPYADYTLQFKAMKNQPTDRVTLHDTGRFAGSFYLVVNSHGFEIEAGDAKTRDLVAKYGSEIFGLTEENKKILISEYIMPELVKKLNEAINGTNK